MNSKHPGAPAPESRPQGQPENPAADPPAISFDAAQQVVDVARFILAGDEPGESEAAAAAQATREPSSDTVQNPAAE